MPCGDWGKGVGDGLGDAHGAGSEFEVSEAVSQIGSEAPRPPVRVTTASKRLVRLEGVNVDVRFGVDVVTVVVVVA